MGAFVQSEEAIERMYNALVDALRSRGSDALERPFTVSEIYQDLIPYRTHRDLLGVTMNGDYEHVLLRLLAGEGGFVELESDDARADLLDELDEANPNGAVIRQFAAVDVRLAQPSVVPAGAAQTAASEVALVAEADLADEAGVTGAGGHQAQLFTLEVEETPVEEDLPAADLPAKDLAAAKQAPIVKAAPAEVATAQEISSTRSCAWCRGELPPREGVKYCPFCGRSVLLVPCSGCHASLEPGWHYCVECGTQART
jgi:hypothetical protein